MQMTGDAHLLTSLLDAAADGILIADQHGIIQRSNNTADTLFGYAPGELVGQNLSILMPPDLAAQHHNFLKRHLETGETRVIGVGREVEARRKDGRDLPVHLSIGRAEVAGAPMFIGILHDLSSRKAAERAAERAQRMDAIGKMTGGIAHDFNNLLTVIIGNLEILEMRLDRNDTSLQLVGDALQSASLGAELTTRLLAFARQSTLSPERTRIPDLVEKTVGMLTRAVGPRYDIVLQASGDLPSVDVDPAQLQTALINLVLNARDAMPDGGRISILLATVLVDDSYVSASAEVAQGKYLRISISDHGSGMTPETQARAFEPFFTTKDTGNASGLGLATVYGFMRQSGGAVTLYSEYGAGTTAHLYLALPSSGDAHTEGALATEPQRGNGQRILVVEDNERVQRLSVARIEALGYEAEAVDKGDAAWARLVSGPAVDLVFTDLVMPGKLTGQDLARLVLAQMPEVKVVMTTGYAQDLDLEGDMALQEMTVLRKPYRQAALAEVLSVALSGGPAAPGNA